MGANSSLLRAPIFSVAPVRQLGPGRHTQIARPEFFEFFFAHPYKKMPCRAATLPSESAMPRIAAQHKRSISAQRSAA
jgi:hypothetical protein